MTNKELTLEELEQVIGSGRLIGEIPLSRRIKEKTISIVRDYWFKSLAIIVGGIWIYGGLMWLCIMATS